MVTEMLMYLAQWQIGKNHPLHLKVQEIATEAYNERKTARG